MGPTRLQLSYQCDS